MQLKVSSITNLTDARFFSAIGAHYLGFCFDVLNVNNIHPKKANEIIAWLHEPVVVAEFGAHQTKEEIEYIASQIDISEIQIPISNNDIGNLHFDKFIEIELTDIEKTLPASDYYVLKTEQINTEDLALKEFIAHHKVFIDAAFTKENIEEIVAKLQPYGIQITCKREEKTGLSSVDEYAEITAAIGFS